MKPQALPLPARPASPKLADSERLAKELATEVTRRLEGHPSFAPLRGQKPNDAFPAGTLYPRSMFEETRPEDEDAAKEEQGSARIHPHRIGLYFFVRQPRGELEATIDFDVWRRLDAPGPETWEPLPPRDALASQDPPKTIRVRGPIDLADPDPGARRITDEVNRQLAEAAAHAAFPGKHGQPVRPSWKAEVSAIVDAMGPDPTLPNRCTIALINDSDAPTETRQQVSEHFLRSRILLNLEPLKGNVQPREPREFRAASKRRKPLFVLGHGLASVAAAQENPLKLWTEAVPLHAKVAIRSPDGIPGLSVEQLANDPAAAVAAFCDAMAAFEREWERASDRLHEAGATPEHLEEFRNDRDAFREELALARKALALLQPGGRRDVARAFAAVFQTFQRANEARLRARAEGRNAAAPVTHLRSFQLGYLLTAIHDMIDRAAACAARDPSLESRADLIWFPTGGGKTEAFQALALFAAFHDRLRGKSRGVTVWLRFALRALTVQQTSRLLELVHHAERIRRADPAMKGEAFRLGFYVGEAYTPTEILPAGSDGYRNRLVDTIEANLRADPARYVYTPECPECHQLTVRGYFDAKRWHLGCRCTNAACAAGELEVYVIDDEIRRQPTAFLVGTIDKIAGVGLTRRFQPLLRSPANACPLHGASVPKRRSKPPVCTARTPNTCGERMDAVNPEDWGPSLVVIDEVHLLEEELGAFAAQYESCLREVQRSAGFPPAKVVLASATVAGYERHVGELAGLPARRFPSPGPTDDRGFWYEREARAQRFIIGIHPHGKTEEDAILYVLRAIHSTLRDMDTPGHRVYIDRLLGRALSPADRAALLRPYLTSFVYLLAKFKGDNLKASMDEQLPRLMQYIGQAPLEHSEIISSDLEPKDQANLINDLEQATPAKIYHVVPATSSIANGMDLRNLNVMALLGQPRRTSEDIQVTSRTGRSNTGLIVRLFHPIRERDLTHYRLYHQYHHNQDLLVEPVPVNRHSMRSVGRTMPGILMALLYNTEQDRQGSANVWEASHAAELLKNEDIRGAIWRQIQRIYKTNQEFDAFDHVVEQTFDNLRSLVESHDEPDRYTQARFPHPPMKSLRDVEEGIPIKVAATGLRPGLLEKMGVDNQMTQSRIQVLTRMLPQAIYAYRRGSAIVQTTDIRPDPSSYKLVDIDKLSVVPRIKHILHGIESLRSLLHLPNGTAAVAERIELVRPGEVWAELFPLTMVCIRTACGHVWPLNARDGDTSCSRCGGRGIQLRHVGVHECGHVASVWIPPCPKGRTHPIALRRAQRVSDWRWACLDCGDEQRVFQKCFGCSGGS